MGKFKASIKKSFFGEYLINIYHFLLCKIMPKIMDDETAVRRFYKKRFGKEIDLNNPRTFCEKINWYKLNGRDPLMSVCSDKVGVRDYITKKGYKNCLNEVYGVYDKVEDIQLENLPEKFVIKAAHGSHMGYIVKNKETFDWKHAKKLLKLWLKQDIYWGGREWVYKDIPKRIIAEEYLEDDAGELRDFKFFCFHGQPVYMEYDWGRFGQKHYRNFYDMEMKLMPFEEADCPANMEMKIFPLSEKVYFEMQNIAKDLSEPFEHVRVDFYYANDKVYIGEMTFFDGGGSTVFSPDEWNRKFSEKWKIL